METMESRAIKRKELPNGIAGLGGAGTS